MKKLVLSLVFIVIVCGLMAQNNKKEIEAIKKVIQTAYVEGIQNEGDVKKIDSGIHSGFNLLGIGEKEEMWVLPIEDWKKRVEKGKADGKYPKPADKEVTIKFKSVDVTGTAAVAKIEFLIGGKLTYVDYIALYKFEEGWKMVNKIYYKFE